MVAVRTSSVWHQMQGPQGCKTCGFCLLCGSLRFSGLVHFYVLVVSIARAISYLVQYVFPLHEKEKGSQGVPQSPTVTCCTRQHLKINWADRASCGRHMPQAPDDLATLPRWYRLHLDEAQDNKKGNVMLVACKGKMSAARQGSS